MELKDKVAVITGGASGLGRAAVKRFVANGAKAAIFDMNEDKGRALADELGDNVIFCQVNVTDEASVVAGIAATMEAFGAIHINCNFAGIGLPDDVAGQALLAGLHEVLGPLVIKTLGNAFAPTQLRNAVFAT